ncbi:MAG: hypothetical protein WC423_20150 [Vulcanimicrobiota bacterium]
MISHRMVLWILVFTLLFKTSFAQTLDGQWQSSSGAGIGIQTTQQGVTITVTPVSGQTERWYGRWLRKWDQFTYVAYGNETVVAQVMDKNRIEAQSSKGNRWTWSRLGAQPDPRTSYEYATRLQGRWFSTSGTTIDLTLQNGKIYVATVDTKGNRYNGEGRWLDTTSFRYGIQGYPDEWVGTFLSDGRIKVIATRANSKVTYWTKQR